MANFDLTVISILDPSHHVRPDGNVSMRFIHVQNGNAAHDFIIDYVSLVEGFTTFTTSDHDGLTGRDSITNHPWAASTDGSRNFTFIASSDWSNVTINEDQILDLGVYISSTELNASYLISDAMNTLAELNTQISGDLISSAELNASYAINTTFADNYDLYNYNQTVGFAEFQYNQTDGAGVYTDEVAAAQDECSEITGCVENAITVDTSAYVNCSTSSVFLGNGSCVDSELFFDDTTIADTTIEDTNATTACSGSEALLGNASCIDIETVNVDTDTDTHMGYTNLALTNESEKFDLNLNVTGNLTLGLDATGEDIYIWFSDDAMRDEYLRWDNTLDRFEISDGFRVTDDLSVGGAITGYSDIYTTQSGHDLWLGASTQSSASFQAYANGTLILEDISVNNNITSIDCITFDSGGLICSGV